MDGAPSGARGSARSAVNAGTMRGSGRNEGERRCGTRERPGERGQVRAGTLQAIAFLVLERRERRVATPARRSARATTREMRPEAWHARENSVSRRDAPTETACMA